MLGVRLEPELEASLARLSRQLRRTKSDIARQAISQYVRRQNQAYLAEAKRQSLEASKLGWTEEDEFWENIAVCDDNGDENSFGIAAE